MGGSGSKTCPQDPVQTINHDKMLRNIDQMFKSVNATQATDLPATDGYSSTSDVDVSTIRPMTGGASFTYTRNRYQQYENKLRAAMRGGANGDEPAGPLAAPVEPVAEPAAAEPAAIEPAAAEPAVAELTAEPTDAEREQLEKQALDLIEANKNGNGNGDATAAALEEINEPTAATLKATPGIAGPPQEMEGFDIGRQMGGMTVDREIENIRSFLLNTNNAQRGGGMDDEMDKGVRMMRDNLLNNQMGGNMVFSATSENPVDYNLVGGTGMAFSATSENPVDYNLVVQAGGNLPLSATSENPVRLNASALSATSENPIDYNLIMRGGAKKGKGKNKKSKKDEDDSTESESSSSTSEDSDASTSEDSSEDSESSISDVGVNVTDIMRLQRGIDKRQNRSNFLRGDYVLTSNSDENYKIDARPYFSSQSSEYQNEIASEFLNTLRSRNRS